MAERFISNRGMWTLRENHFNHELVRAGFSGGTGGMRFKLNSALEISQINMQFGSKPRDDLFSP